MIYVDPLKTWTSVYDGHAAKQAQRVGAANRHRWCHLVSDMGRGELLEFAHRIGLRDSWLQGDARKGYHFDLTPARREAAVKAGAVEVTSREIVLALRRSRVEAI